MFDNLQVSFEESPPVQSKNILQKEWVWFPIKNIFRVAGHKIAGASVESLQFAGGIYIY